MAKGKFSAPRPYREEDRQIEKAYRQLTGQEPANREPLPDAPEDFPPFPAADDTPLSDTGVSPPDAGTQTPVEHADAAPASAPLPEADDADDWEDEDKTFLDTLLDFGNRAFDFFSANKKVVLVGLCAAALMIIVTFITIFFASTADPYDRKILNNVYVAGVNMGGMTKSEAVSAVRQAADTQYTRNPMVVELAGTELVLSPADISPSLNAKAAVNAAYDFGRVGTNAEKEQARQLSLSGRYDVPLSRYLELNERRLREALTSHAAQAGDAVVQTQYGLEGTRPSLSADTFDENAPGQTLVITMGTPGVRFDVDSVLRQLLDAYADFTFQVTVEDTVEATSRPDPLDLDAVYDEFYIAPVDATVDPATHKPVAASYGYRFDLQKARELLKQAEYGEVLRIPMEYIEPEVMASELLYLDVLGEYQTACTASPDRTTNLQLACQALDGLTLEPGRTFSFNEALGEPTREKGYLSAPIDPDVSDERVSGGGISQVASTLYYCALLSEMNITDRSCHDTPVSYIDYGLDADIRWGHEDLKFTNTSMYPIKLQAEVTSGSVSVRILGTEQRDYYVKLESRIQNTYVPDREYEDYEPDNEDGYQDGDVIRKGRNGFHIKSYILKYDRKTNELLSREAFSDSRYQAVNELVARIPSETTAETTEETTEESIEETTEDDFEDFPEDDWDDSDDVDDPGEDDFIEDEPEAFDLDIAELPAA